MPQSTAEQIAHALGVDRRRVFEYVRLGMPKLGPGRFDGASNIAKSFASLTQSVN